VVPDESDDNGFTIKAARTRDGHESWTARGGDGGSCARMCARESASAGIGHAPGHRHYRRRMLRGNVGHDLLVQARGSSIDFSAMTLQFEQKCR
jgi:hypothetical protein